MRQSVFRQSGGIFPVGVGQLFADYCTLRKIGSYLMNSGGPEPLAVFNNLAVAAKREVFRHNIIGELGDRIR